ncbi:hypothetical protein GEMRC1_005878 [Eukaryota sp. GEM-RC1]
MSQLDHHLCPTNLPISILDSTEAFELLSDREKLFAFHFSQAVWSGLDIIIAQVSEESPAILSLLTLLFSNYSLSELNDKAQSLQLPSDLVTFVAEYFVVCSENKGNYLGFGDAKIIPRFSSSDFSALIAALPLSYQLAPLFNSVSDAMFSLSEQDSHLSLSKSAYYQGTFTLEEVKEIQQELSRLSILPHNTRVFKSPSGQVDVLVSSVGKKGRAKGEVSTHLWGFFHSIIQGC